MSTQRVTSQPLMIRVGSDHLIVPPEVGGDIVNLYATEEGTLRSVWGPCPYVPLYGSNGAPAASDTSAQVSGPLTYGPMRGIHHAVILNNREILLVHTYNEIWVFEGWNQGWKCIIGPSGSSPLVEAELPTDLSTRFPTQFETTPNGVIIIPQGSRAYFYDGVVCAEFGYANAPSPPSGLGPHTEDATAINDAGYSHDSRVDPANPTKAQSSAMRPFFGTCRLGSVENANQTGSDLGYLKPARFRARVQWVDRWGNLSPASPPSNDVTFDRQEVVDTETSPGPTELVPDRALKQIAWETIEPGRGATVARILLRTKDLLNSGSPVYWEMPANAAGGASEFATIMDNSATMFPDNVPDNWLTAPMVEVVPMPMIHLAKVAFGVCWVAYGGTIHPSLPGRYGTLEFGKEIIPDAQGARITGLYPVPSGLIATTESSTYLVERSDDGLNYRSRTIHAKAGCVAPSSFATMASGLVVWLGREGFYAFDGQQVQLISQDIFRRLRDRNKAREGMSCGAYDPKEGTYRCWVPQAGSRGPDTCYMWDGEGWRTRDDVVAQGVCVMQNHTGYMLVAGRVGASTWGVWLLDHAVGTYAYSRTASLETGWLRAMDGGTRRKSPRHVIIWLRETNQSTVTVEAMRDWREEVIYTSTQAKRYWESDVPTFIGDALSTTSGARWEHRRPYWTRVAIDIPDCEVFKIRVSGTGDWEFVGMQLQDVTVEMLGSRSEQ